MNNCKKIFVWLLFFGFLSATVGIGIAGAAEQTYKFKMPHVFSSTSTQHKAALYFADLVKKKTKGQVEIKVFGDGLMGGDREIGEGLQRGSIEMSFVNYGSLSGFNKKLDLTNMPYSISSYEQADRLIYGGGWLGQEIGKYMLEIGIRNLEFFENDFRAMTNNRKPIKSVEDVKGLKFRVPPAPSLVKLFTKMGAVITPMAFPELYTGLQQKTVDGQENGILLTESSRLYEVQKYMTRTNHMYTAASIAISNKVWQGLTPELQKELLAAAKETSKYQREINRAAVNKSLDIIKKSGVEVIDLTPEQMKGFINVGRSIWSEFEGVFPAGVLDRLRKEQ